MFGPALIVVTVLLAVSTPAAAQLQATRVQGVVLDAQDQRVPDVRVTLVDALGATLHDTTSDQAGRFLLDGVQPGRFQVRADAGTAVPVHMPLTIEAALPVEVTIRLPPALAETVVVEAGRAAASTFSSLGGATLAAIPARIRSRSLQDAIATLPGWATEDNGLLHARGVDDGFLYVIDGVPVYERLDALNGVAPDLPALASLNVVTGYIAPEFGYKAGGVIEVRTAEPRRRWSTTGEVGAGSFRTTDAGLMTGGALGAVDLQVGGTTQRSDRFLDPVHPDNFHNDGSAASLFGRVRYQGTGRDQLRLGWRLGRSRYDVPNTDEQEEAGQEQRQRLSLGLIDTTWQRAWSSGTVTQVTGYHRRSAATLDGSAFDTPIFAGADRALVRTGAIAALTHQRGRHVLKAGIEAQALRMDETFLFFVTDEDEAEEAGLSEAALAFDDDDPFSFASQARPRLWSIFLQDNWQAGDRLTMAAGVRFDRSTLLLDRHQWSPRVGATYGIGASTQLRASISRFFQPPQPEFLLLSSSEAARELSPFASGTATGGSTVEPERQWAFEAGVEHRFPAWQLNAAYWRREGREASDPNVFFSTTVIFPNAVAESRAQGLDVRVDVPRRRGWSAYASAGVGKVTQTGPITGGLFLEDEIGDIGPGDEFLPDHDQRVVLASGLMWDSASSGMNVSLTARYESGTPIQRDDDDDDLAERPGADLADFARGRVRPRTVVSLVASAPLHRSDRVEVRVRGSVLNLFDDDYAYNFGNPFSGTHFGAPRTAAITLQIMGR